MEHRVDLERLLGQEWHRLQFDRHKDQHHCMNRGLNVTSIDQPSCDALARTLFQSLYC